MDNAGPHSEFLFGRLSTPAGRADALRALAAGGPILLPTDPTDPLPGQPVCIRVTAGPDLDIESVWLNWTSDGKEPAATDQADPRVPMALSPSVWDTLSWGYRGVWTATLPGLPDGTLVRFRAVARLRDGRWLEATVPSATTSNLPSQGSAYHVDHLTVPAWLHQAVIYHVLPDRFAPDPPRTFPAGLDLNAVHGGTLRGLTARLGELADLGINCLWLGPIHPSPSYHGYDPSDLAEVEPRLGTLADWDDLVRAAHARGMRLLLDFVANHVSSRHPAFLAARQDRHSSQHDWFHFERWPDRYRCFFAIPGMPMWNTAHPEVYRHLLDHARMWLDRGCSGFRLDHAHGPGPAFWARFRAELRASHPESVLLGEITDPPDQLLFYQGKLDGCLDFLLAEALRGFFTADRPAAGRLAALLERHFAYCGATMALPSFLDNHDMNRFLWLARGDTRRLRLAALCQVTLPGPPVFYYGTEVGLSQRAAVGRLEEARLPMPGPGQGDQELRRTFAALIALRRACPTAWTAPRVLRASGGLLTYRTGPYVVVLNNTDQAVPLSQEELGASQVVFATETASGIVPPRAGVVLG